MNMEPPLVTNGIKFKKVDLLPKGKFQLDPPTEIELLWPHGGVAEFEFHYTGNHGLLFIPLPGIFEPINGQDQLFELGKGKKNKGRGKPHEAAGAKSKGKGSTRGKW